MLDRNTSEQYISRYLCVCYTSNENCTIDMKKKIDHKNEK